MTTEELREAAKRFEAGEKVRIRFRAATRWSGATVWRHLTGVRWENGWPSWFEVKYGGWSDFAVWPIEVKEVEYVGKEAV